MKNYSRQNEINELSKQVLELIKIYLPYDEKRKLDLMAKLKNKKVATTLALLCTTSILGLSGCAKQNNNTEEFIESETINEINISDNQESELEKETKFAKDDLKLALLWNLEGKLEYRVIRFEDEIVGSFLNTNLQVERRSFTSPSHKYETRTIVNYDYYLEDKGEKYLYRNCSNAIYLDRIYTIPDFNLQAYYGIMDLNTLNLPGKFKIQTEYSLEDIIELENLLNQGLLDLNQNELKSYDLNNLSLIKCDSEYLIVDHTDAIYTTDIFNPIKKEIYYDIGVLDNTKAVKYERTNDLDSLDVANINDYNLVGLTSSNPDLNQDYQNKPVEVLNLADYLNSTQKIVGKLSYDEIKKIEEELNQSVKLKLK